MLSTSDFESMRDSVVNPHKTKVSIRSAAERIRSKLNPHPAGQQDENVPIFNQTRMEGMQHKYRSTLLFFPMEVNSTVSLLSPSDG
jgi:hypothetical protein